MGGCGCLSLFEWAPHCIVGHKVVPAGLNSYAVRKIPFLWMGLSEEGLVSCFLDPSFKKLGKIDVGSSPMLSSQPSSFMHDNISASSSSNNGQAISWDPKAMLATGMLLVDVHFVGNHHLVIEEIVQQPGCVINELAEAATLAAFGSNHNFTELSPSTCGSNPCPSVTSPQSSSSETESYIGSPPGSFQYEMYQFLVSKVTSSGGDRAVRKQRRRGKERYQGRYVLDPEHFVKVIHTSPTKARPLQGLWKGFFDSAGLDFVLVSYDDKEGIVCRKVQDMAGPSRSGSVLWTSKSNTRIGLPLCLAEQAVYGSRTHTGPVCSVLKPGEMNQAVALCEEVVGSLSTSSCDFQSLLASSGREGRIWQYANGMFGFGYLNSSSIIDFRALCSQGFLLDVVD